jgi:hypothetical protein
MSGEQIVFVLSHEWPPSSAPCEGMSVCGVFPTAADALTYLFDSVVSPPKDYRPNLKPFGGDGWSVWLDDDRGGAEYLVTSHKIGDWND